MTVGKTPLKSGRRKQPRIIAQFPVEFRFKADGRNFRIVQGITSNLSEEGVSCRLHEPIPATASYAYLSVVTDQKPCAVSGRIMWVNSSGNECGVKVENATTDWKQFILATLNDARTSLSSDRRRLNRRSTNLPMDAGKRSSDRRFQDLTAEISDDETQEVDEAQKVKVKKFLRNKATTYTAEMIQSRREWLAELTQTQLKHLAHFSEDPEDFKGKIECPIGVAHVPVGIAGPLRINGEHARGVFFIPMATTEGALITSYTFGSNIITRSGGVTVKILKDALKSDPTFVFKSSAQAQSFVTWIENNFGRIKEIAEKTSGHLRLIKAVPMINGRRVILCFHFQTGDAIGMNMAYKATDVVCKMIRDSVDPEEFWLHSNFTTIKKTTAENFVNGYGKSVMADVTIPRKLVERLNTTPEQMERFFLRTLLGSAQGVLFGISAHMANAMTAIAIACGQDAALVANTHCANITCEATKNGDLYFSAYFPSMFAATVGGGTSFGTARECLETLGCYGNGKSKRFAEIIAATALAGEISLMTSIVNGTYIYAHETFGRNRPPQ